MYRNSDKDSRSLRRDNSDYARIGAENGFYTKGRTKEYFDRPRNVDTYRNDPIFDEPDDSQQDHTHDWSNKQKRRSENQDYHRGDRGKERDSYRSKSPSPSYHHNREERRSSSSSQQRRSKFHDDPSGSLYGSLKKKRSSRSKSPFHKKKRRSASSESSSSSSSSADSPDFTQKNKPGDDFFKSMYSRAKENIRTDDNESASLIQNVRKTEGRKSLNVPVVDEEDIFLYGTKEQTTMKKPPIEPLPRPVETMPKPPLPPRIPEPPPPVPVPQPIENKTTPGGFDSHALQNVLKAIGFNFEMSAQSQLKFGTENSQPIPPKSIQEQTGMQLHANEGKQKYNPFTNQPIVPSETRIRNQMIPQQNNSNLPDRQLNRQQANSSSDEQLHVSDRKMRLEYLKETLSKLKNQQNELIRKKRMERGNKHPLIEKNTMLQVEVEDEIKKIRKLAEAAAGITSDEEDKIHYEYFDPGNHWCKPCNVVCTNVYQFLTHLHSKQHKKLIDPYDRPWMSHGKQEKIATKKGQTIAAPLKGTAFLLPVAGYYCSLCDMFAGDQTCAEDHFKTDIHNENYKKYCRTNPAFEEKRKLDMAAALSMMTPVRAKSDNQESTAENNEKNRQRCSPSPQKYKEISPRQPKTNQRQPREEKKASSRPQRERKKRWSPGYDEYERMQENKKESRSRWQPANEKETRDNTTPVDMEIEDEQPTYKSHKINLENNDQDIVTAKVIHHKSHSNEDTIINKTKLAIPFSVKQTEKSVRTRIDSTSSTKSSKESTDKKAGTSFKISNDKKTAEQVRKQNALRAKLSAITVPSARSMKKPGLKKPGLKITAVQHTPPENIKFKAIVKQRTELAKVAQTAWGHNFNAYGGMMQYNYAGMSQPMPGQNTIPFPPPETSAAVTTAALVSEQPPPPVKEIKEELPDFDIEIKEKGIRDVVPAVLDGITISEDKEPPPPGEDASLDGNDGNASDASGISMEIASDEE